MGSEGLEPTTPAVFMLKSQDQSSQSGVLTKLDDEPTKVQSISRLSLNALSERLTFS